METIKIFNNKKSGYLFHYAHFICDALFTTFTSNPEAPTVKKKILRAEHPEQTLGVFKNIFERILNCEVEEVQLSKIIEDPDLIKIPRKENLFNASSLNNFRSFIFKKVSESNIKRTTPFPEVLLIKRKTQNLVSSPRMRSYLDKYKEFAEQQEGEDWRNVLSLGDLSKNGSERREINRIDTLDRILKEIYRERYQGVYLEDIKFEEQVAYFSQARVIICAHGAAISNMMFANPLSTLIEVNDFPGGHNPSFPFFDTITTTLQCRHIKTSNHLEKIIGAIPVS